MQAVILAGGKGTRLKPYTMVLPKPMMPIGDYTILEIVIRQLKHAGFSEIILAVGYLEHLMRAYFGDGERWGLKIRYSREDKPLGTAAPLKLIDGLGENFLVMNGDILCDIDYNALIRHHLEHMALCTISMYGKPVKIDLGVLEIDADGFLTDYIEKPVLNYRVSMGIYMFNREALAFIPDEKFFDFPMLIEALLAGKQPVKGFPFDGSWLDIGRHEDFEIAVDTFEQNRQKYLPDL